MTERSFNLVVPLDTPPHSVYRSPVTVNSVTGIGVLNVEAARSRWCQPCGFFHALVLPQWAGRAGSRKARQCLHWYANPFGSAHPDWRRGARFFKRTGGITMSTSTQEPSDEFKARLAVSKLNPLIGITANETMSNCEGLISDLGYLASSAIETGLEIRSNNLFRVFETIAAALRYEIKGTWESSHE